MPRLVISATKSTMEGIASGFENIDTFYEAMEKELTRTVANSMSQLTSKKINSAEVGVQWIQPVRATNEADFPVDLIFSEGEQGFTTTQDIRDSIQLEVLAFLAVTPLLQNGMISSVWPFPQTGSRYKECVNKS